MDAKDTALKTETKREPLITDTKSLKFDRDPWGRLVLFLSDGRSFVGVEPVRCFPLSDPQKAIALLDGEGHEILTLPDLDALNVEARQVVEGELTARDFMPVIQRVISVSNPHPPCQWVVKTDRGDTQFQLESEDDIRKLSPHRVMIADANGLRYAIEDIRQLDSATRRIVQRLV